MKLNYKRIILVGFAFFLIQAFWQAYDNTIPMILTNKFGMSQAWSGAIMALDNVLALFMLPLFGAISDKHHSKWGRRTPFIVVGPLIAAVMLIALSFVDNAQLHHISDVAAIDDPAALETIYDREADETLLTPGGQKFVLSRQFTKEEFTQIRSQITVDGVTRPLEEPFLVIATQNPLETLGTFPLPEAQMDRFLMKLSMEALSPAEETQMIARFLTEEPLAELYSVCQKEEIRALQEACKEVYLHPELVQYLVRIVQETRVNSKIASGVSPRGTLAFLRAVQGHALVQGRNYVVPEDFKTVAVPVLAHRLTMQIGADDGRAAESVIEEILNRIDLPTENWSGR